MENYGGPEEQITRCKNILKVTTTIKKEKQIFKKQYYTLENRIKLQKTKLKKKENKSNFWKIETQ